MALKDKMIEHIIQEVEFLEIEDRIESLLGDNWREILADDQSDEIFYKNISDVALEISEYYGE